jgi:hypothetical protein
MPDERELFNPISPQGRFFLDSQSTSHRTPTCIDPFDLLLPGTISPIPGVIQPESFFTTQNEA